MNMSEKICLALDFSDGDTARNFARRFEGKAGWFKVGLELFVSEGPGLVGDIARYGKVFLDLKLHDIPNTVARSAAAAVRTGASMINVHAGGGAEMMKAGAMAMRQEAARLALARPLAIAVTILTSLDGDALSSVGVAGTPAEAAARRAALAKESGLDGVVCSAADLPMIRQVCGDEFLTVVPGIRPVSAEADDQKRVATPRAALAAGASMLVIGRPVTQSNDPEAALKTIVAEMS